VHPRSLEIFEALGIVDRLLAAGVKTRAARLHSDGEVVGELDLGLTGSRVPSRPATKRWPRPSSTAHTEVKGGRRRRRLRAATGPRLPDTGHVEPVDGDPRPLHELTHRRGHTLIVLGGSQANADRVATLATELEGRPSAGVDAVVGLCTRPGGPQVGRIDESVAAQLGVVGATVLAVRSDRYIDFRNDSDPGAVAAYLDALLS
jgi:hypothetical protein